MRPRQNLLLNVKFDSRGIYPRSTNILVYPRRYILREQQVTIHPTFQRLTMRNETLIAAYFLPSHRTALTSCFFYSPLRKRTTLTIATCKRHTSQCFEPEPATSAGWYAPWPSRFWKPDSSRSASAIVRSNFCSIVRSMAGKLPPIWQEHKNY